MSHSYAKDQPAGYSNHIRNVAIVGATGQQGSHIVDELLHAGKHTITAITREGSSISKVSTGVKVAYVNYDKPETLVAALKDQDALVITMSVTAPPDTSVKLVTAAAEAHVKWILPDEWGSSGADEQFNNDIFLGPAKKSIRDLIEKLAVSSWVAVAGGFWYQYSLGTMKEMYGFDIPGRQVTFFDDGKARINTSTWDQVARAAVGVLSMKILPDDENDEEPCLERDLKNTYCHVKSFTLSQRDMLASLERVTNTTDADWKITHENSKERYGKGLEMLHGGNQLGFLIAMYTRAFYPEEPLLLEKYGYLRNEMLKLPVEDLDACTKEAVEGSVQAAAGRE